MQGAVRTMQRAGWATLSRTLSTLCEVPASAARWAGPLLPPAALEAFSRPAASAGERGLAMARLCSPRMLLPPPFAATTYCRCSLSGCLSDV